MSAVGRHPGGGILGPSLALHLAERGVSRVELLEREAGAVDSPRLPTVALRREAEAQCLARRPPPAGQAPRPFGITIPQSSR